MNWIFSIPRRLRLLSLLMSYAELMDLSVTHSTEREKKCTSIELKNLNVRLVATEDGDLEVSVPRGLILSSKIMFFDTDGVSRLHEVERTLEEQGLGEYKFHPEEEEYSYETGRAGRI